METLSASVALPPSRRLGALEHFFWLADQNRPTHFAMVAEIAGVTSLDQWRRAIDTVRDMHSILRSSIEVNADGLPFFQPLQKPVNALRIVEEADWRWELEVTRELQSSFARSTAPLVRFVLERRESMATLIVVAHHAVADGMSVVYLIREILDALTKQPVRRATLSEPLETRLGDRLASLPKDYSVDSERIPQRKQVNLRPVDGPPPKVQTHALGRTFLAQLIRRAHGERVTIHAVLGAAFSLASRNMEGASDAMPIQLFSPVSMRPEFVRDGEAIGVFLAAVITSLKSGDSTFWRLAREFTEILREERAPERLLRSVGGLEAAIASNPPAFAIADLMTNSFNWDILLSNLGDLSIPTNYGALTLRAIWGPSVSLGLDREQAIGVATLGNILRLVHTSYKPLEGLLDEAVRILTDALVESSAD
ncbi:condensation domain-containing protein [Paraburkholderia sp. BL6669N2]|uniref:condensation domain-containing protein n=1 Tax=Paraburkholderia sp. BL6669N2 TaxID=1938807 RepID=UPI000E226D2B|nr:condensation domain-containing protein [Paraburkholderia sp. BL6669N2]REG49629.1 condensation domain-containing protein [Paraburkholderia sp. BL6669N2]